MNQPALANTNSDTPRRTLAWAGLMTQMPIDWRITDVQGDAKRGRLTLGDRQQVRFELAWARVTRKRFDPENFAKRQLMRSAPRGQRDIYHDTITRNDTDAFKPLLTVTDPLTGMRRGVGYVQANRRVIEYAYAPDPQADAVVRDLSNQDDDVPHQWAFFSSAFSTPIDFELESCELNLGDMRVYLQTNKGRERLMIAQVYPDDLALRRGDLRFWLDAIIQPQKGIYRLPRRAKPIEIKTPLGPALMLDMKLRGAIRLLRRRIPQASRCLVIHDSERARLHLVCLQTSKHRMDERIAQTLTGLEVTHSARALEVAT